jgi:hypothetical protein
MPVEEALARRELLQIERMGRTDNRWYLLSARQTDRPAVIRSDNRREFTGRALLTWTSRNSVALRRIEPGKSNQNAYIEISTGDCAINVLTNTGIGDMKALRTSQQFQIGARRLLQ